mgnify:CR=1 FL=1
MDFDRFIDRLRSGISSELPGRAAHRRMMPVFPQANISYFSDKPLRQAAVLICLFPLDGIPHTVLIERTQDAGPHSGQIAFPGGRYEESDSDLTITALREAYEEVAIDPDCLQVLGNLSAISIPVSGFSVLPVIAYTHAMPDFIPATDEVKSLMVCPVEDLLKSKTSGKIRVRDFEIEAPYYLANGRIVWGATAMLLSELECVLYRLTVESLN